MAVQLLSHAGVYDEFGRELTHAHIQEHYQHMLGVPLMHLIKHAQTFSDDPTHPIHQDVAEAAHSRLAGIWTLDKYDAPIEYYAAKWLGCDEKDINWEKLSPEVQSKADIALKRNHRPIREQWREERLENLLLTVGITALWNITTGNPSASNSGASPAGANAVFNNAQARMCIGDSSTAASAGQTWLQAATNKWCQVQDSTFPTISTNTSTFRITVTGSNALFSWQEFVMDNCGGSNATSTTQSGGSALDRVVSNQGTKASGQTWQPSMALALN